VVSSTYCVVFLHLVYSMLSVSLDYPFGIIWRLFDISFIAIGKKCYECKLIWETIQHDTWTPIKVKEKRFYYLSTFNSHSRFLNHGNNSYPKMCVKHPLACTWAKLFISCFPVFILVYEDVYEKQRNKFQHFDVRVKSKL